MSRGRDRRGSADQSPEGGLVAACAWRRGQSGGAGAGSSEPSTKVARSVSRCNSVGDRAAKCQTRSRQPRRPDGSLTRKGSSC